MTVSSLIEVITFCVPVAIITWAITKERINAKWIAAAKNGTPVLIGDEIYFIIEEGIVVGIALKGGEMLKHKAGEAAMEKWPQDEEERTGG